MGIDLPNYVDLSAVQHAPSKYLDLGDEAQRNMTAGYADSLLAAGQGVQAQKDAGKKGNALLQAQAARGLAAGNAGMARGGARSVLGRGAAMDLGMQRAQFGHENALAVSDAMMRAAETKLLVGEGQMAQAQQPVKDLMMLETEMKSQRNVLKSHDYIQYLEGLYAHMPSGPAKDRVYQEVIGAGGVAHGSVVAEGW